MSTFTLDGRTIAQEVLKRGPAGPTKISNVLCADGVVRTARLAETGPDTFFSIPARVSVRGRTVSGYVTCETIAGFSSATDDDPAVYKFCRVDYGKNAELLPKGAYKRDLRLIAAVRAILQRDNPNEPSGEWSRADIQTELVARYPGQFPDAYRRDLMPEMHAVLAELCPDGGRYVGGTSGYLYTLATSEVAR
jgi:hypothetical protein